MLRFPRARGPNSMRPCIHATILLSFSAWIASLDQLAFRLQIPKPQFAVFQNAFDLGGRVGGPRHRVSNGMRSSCP